MKIQRLRNLTTGKLHTSMKDIYEDLEFITGQGGIMTHMIPRIMRSIEPWLRQRVPDDRFWDGAYDITHTGDYPLEPMTADEFMESFKRYQSMPDPLAGKDILVVRVDDTRKS